MGDDQGFLPSFPAAAAGSAFTFCARAARYDEPPELRERRRNEKKEVVVKSVRVRAVDVS